MQVVVIGISGLDMPLVKYFINRKKLPFFNKLLSSGVHVPLANNIDYLHSDLWKEYFVYKEYIKKETVDNIYTFHAGESKWVSLLTGCLPSEHKVLAPLGKNAKGVRLPLSRFDRKRPYFWETLYSQGKKLGIIGWIADWPLKDYSYYHLPHICNFASEAKTQIIYNNKSFLSSKLIRGLLKDIGSSEQANHFVRRINKTSASLLGKEIICDSLYINWAKRLLKQFPQPDLFGLCLHSIHTLSHFFWDCIPRENRYFKRFAHRARFKKYGNVIEDYYSYLDNELENLSKFFSKNTLMFVISPFGMRRFNITKKYLKINKLYQELGFLSRTSHGIDWVKTVVYDDENPWGIFPKRKGFINKRNNVDCQHIFQEIRRSLSYVTIDRKYKLFLDISFGKSKCSFVLTPNYKRITYSSKIFINQRPYSIRKFVVFLPHYSLHSSQGTFIAAFLSRKSRLKVLSNNATILDVAPTVLNLLGADYKGMFMGKNILAIIKGR